VPDDDLGRVERVLYLSAAMSGLRLGELLALRWMDVDWAVSLIRARRAIAATCGESPRATNRPAPSLWPTGSPANLTGIIRPEPSRATVTSCSATPLSAPPRRVEGPQAALRGDEGGRARAPVRPQERDHLPLVPAHVRHPDGRGPRRSAPYRSGSATRDRTPPRSTATTPPTRPAPRLSSTGPSPRPRVLQRVLK
jgi:hypothetical protein